MFSSVWRIGLKARLWTASLEVCSFPTDEDVYPPDRLGGLSS